MGFITSECHITAEQPDPAEGNNADTEATIVQGIDLSITLSASPDPKYIYQEISYTLTFRNNSGAEANGVTVTDELGGGLIFISTSLEPSYKSNEIITWDIGSLAAGAERSITIITSTPVRPGVMSNYCAVSGHQPDPVPENNTQYTDARVDLRPGEFGPAALGVIAALACLEPDSRCRKENAAA
jgi:uncharacterized repeat protein (TIGR01451 family)